MKDGIKKRILIIGNENAGVVILRETLHDKYDLKITNDSHDCINEISKFRPDLVLLNVTSPNVNSYEICRNIKSDISNKFVQVIIVSGKEANLSPLKFYEAGADDYIAGPFDGDEIVAKVRVQLLLKDTLTELETANTRLQMKSPRTGRQKNRPSCAYSNRTGQSAARSRHRTG